MKFSKFSEYLDRLEKTPKRLEITTILSELINELESSEAGIAIYLSLGYLKAPFENKNFNIADKLMVKILEQASGEDAKILYAQLGDLGNVAEKLFSKQKSSTKSIQEVYEQMLEVAFTEGSGSVDGKTRKAAELLNSMDALSAKFATRIILGTLRLGFTELTVIASLAELIGDKNAAQAIEHAYYTRPDIGLIVKNVKKDGLKGLKNIKMAAGVPVLSQKASRVSGMEEAFERIPNVWAEFKFDGTRVQLHMDKATKVKAETPQESLFEKTKDAYLIKTFTRNLEETTHQYPDLVEAAQKQIKADSVILDGEAIGFNRETGEFLPFQETIQRKRKYDVQSMTETIPLKYFVFDILYLNGELQIDKPLKERKKILKTVIKSGDTIKIAENFETKDFDKLVEYYEEAKEKGLEGIIVKNSEDPYQAGARSYSWIKLKKADEKLLDDSVDCVLLGYYHGKGVRSKFGIGGFLVGVYDTETDTFKTITKVGTGLTDEEWAKIKTMADKFKVKELPVNVVVNKMLIPDVIVSPKIVLEIGADEISISQNHTAGYALRFPRLIKFREDKSPIETTTVKEIQIMHRKQKR